MFAEGYNRTEKGWIEFPDSDRTGGLRAQLFKEKVEHPAKNNIYMMEEIFKYCLQGVEKPRALDPMAGGGSSMIGASYCDTLFLIELEPYFQELLSANKIGFGENIVLLKGNCIDILPRFKHSLDLITFSPPYSNQVQVGKGIKTYEKAMAGGGKTVAEAIAQYTSHPDNLSNKPEFQFNQLMKQIYKLCLQALKPGGYMVIIIKNQIKNWKLVDYETQHVRMACREGFKMVLWEHHTHIGKLFGNHNIKQGYRQVEYEGVLFFKSPSDS